MRYGPTSLPPTHTGPPEIWPTLKFTVSHDYSASIGVIVRLTGEEGVLDSTHVDTSNLGSRFAFDQAIWAAQHAMWSNFTLRARQNDWIKEHQK